VAQSGDAIEVPKNTIRTETITATSLTKMERVGPADTSWGVYDCTSDGRVIVQSRGTFYTIPDTTTLDTWSPTKVIDLVDIGPEITTTAGIVVLDNGWWLFSGGGLTGDEPVNGYIYLSKDEGSTWSLVLTLDKGRPIVNNLRDGKLGSHIAIGEYSPAKWAVDGPRKVYYSEDYGESWDIIYDPGPLDVAPDVNTGRHVHDCVFASDSYDTVYISYGDGTWKKILKITKPEGWVFGDGLWADEDDITGPPPAKVIARAQPTALLAHNDYIYCGMDGAHRASIVRRIDTRDDTIHAALTLPYPMNDASVPYRLFNAGQYSFGILHHDGIFYLCTVMDVGTGDLAGSRRKGGVYVSEDGIHWTCAARMEGSGNQFGGVCYPACISGGYLWAKCTTPDGYETVHRIKLVDAKTIEAIRIEKGTTNIFTDGDGDDSYFPTGMGHWTFQYNYDDELCGYDDSESLTGTDGSIKVVGEYNPDEGKTGTTVQLWSGRLLEDYGQNSLADGDLIVVTFWVKTDPNWPSQVELRPAFYNGFNRIKHSDIAIFAPTQDWQKVTVWGRVTAAGAAHTNSKLLIKAWDSFGTNTEPYSSKNPAPYHVNNDWGDITFWVDCVQMAIVPASAANTVHRHLSSSTFQYGNKPRADEVVSFPLAGVGSEFTITFSWIPDCSSREWGPGTTYADVMIAHIEDPRGKYIDIYYDTSEGAFVADDGTNQARTSAMTWEFMDVIHFAVVTGDNDGTPIFTLKVQTPRNDVVLLSADSIGKDFGSAAMLTIGTDQMETDFGCGLFYNIRAWNSELSETDIIEAFNTVDEILAE
jgi:hypothetical protein